MIGIIVRAVLRFLFGMAWLVALIFSAAVLLCLGLACLVEALCFVWTVITGLLYVFTRDPQMYHQFWWWLLLSAVGMGLTVVVFGAIWDVFCAIRGRTAQGPLRLRTTPE
jgi:hypothetical protein